MRDVCSRYQLPVSSANSYDPVNPSSQSLQKAQGNMEAYRISGNESCPITICDGA